MELKAVDKLRATEEIWRDLQRTPGDETSPAWHEVVLKAREQRLREGKTQFADWAVAWRRLHRRTR